MSPMLNHFWKLIALSKMSTVAESGKKSGVTGDRKINQDGFMRIADFREAAMEWTMTIEGCDGIWRSPAGAIAD
jgi:hypothetical protein